MAFGDDAQCDAINCYLVKKQPTTGDWSKAYAEDLITSALLQFIYKNVSRNKQESNQQHNTALRPRDIKHIYSCFHQYLLAGTIAYEHGRIVVYKEIAMMNRSVRLIVVPHAMQRIIFQHYHASPTGGHAGEYKTLYRLRLRFLWPKMQETIKMWVRNCAECVAAQAWKNRRSELYFSWPVTIPFWIMHVDLWSPGTTTVQGKKGYLLNCVCDLTQFVVSSVTVDITAHHLAKVFIENNKCQRVYSEILCVLSCYSTMVTMKRIMTPKI